MSTTYMSRNGVVKMQVDGHIRIRLREPHGWEDVTDDWTDLLCDLAEIGLSAEQPDVSPDASDGPVYRIDDENEIAQFLDIRYQDVTWTVNGTVITPAQMVSFVKTGLLRLIRIDADKFAAAATTEPGPSTDLPGPAGI